MESLGVVEEITAEGNAVARSKDAPDVGSPVFDAGGRRVGTVRRIFGPVDEPYVSIAMERAPFAPDSKRMTLYFKKGAKNGKDKRRNRRD
jgi:RNA-binding protein